VRGANRPKPTAKRTEENLDIGNVFTNGKGMITSVFCDSQFSWAQGRF
jgi:hypothetical protein